MDAVVAHDEGCSVETFRDLWDNTGGWLNTASYGLPPLSTLDKLAAVLDEWRAGGATWQSWDEATPRARAAFARLIGANQTDVAVGSTVAAALAPFAASLTDASTVLVSEEEFTSAVFPWQVHADRGVRIKAVPTVGMLEAIRPGIDVVSVSAVQSATGKVLDIRALKERCRAVEALLVVDASQAAGWLPLRAHDSDVLVAHSYKWLMAPRGVTFCYMSPQVRQGVRPLNASWYAASDVFASFYGTHMDLANDARRFDQSTAWFSMVGAAESLAVVERIGVQAIHDHNVGLANRFRAGRALETSDSAIVATHIPGAEQALAKAGIRAVARNGNLRMSFHAYTTRNDVDAALTALAGSPT